jgi:hypothetical protein
MEISEKKLNLWNYSMAHVRSSDVAKFGYVGRATTNRNFMHEKPADQTG